MTVIDLSQLPPPDVVETLDAERIVAAMTADFRRRYPDYDAWVESDPAMKLLEVAAYREVLLRQCVNEAARAVLLAFAKGADLDHLAALYGIERLEDEDDRRLLERVQLAPETWTTAGNGPGYRAVVLGLDVAIADVQATSPTPGAVKVSVLGANDTGIPAAPLIAQVDAAVQASHVRPLTDTVAAATVTAYDVTAVLHLPPGPDSALVAAAARKALDAYTASRRKIRLGVALSGISGALHVANVDRVALTAPAADLPATDHTAYIPGAVAIDTQQS